MSEKDASENQEIQTQKDSAYSVQPADRNQALVNIIAMVVMILAVSQLKSVPAIHCRCRRLNCSGSAFNPSGGNS